MRLLPQPYPDELIGSVIGRGLVRSGLPSDRFLLRLTGRDVGTLSFFLPSDLCLVADAAGVPAAHLLWEHTPLPYAVAFMPPLSKHRFAFRALAHSASNGKSLSALVQSCCQGFTGLKYCPQCRDDEVGGYGESYWHRQHNLPGVFVCLRHGCALWTSGPAELGRAYKAGQPHHQRGSHCGFQPSDALLELASRSAKLLDRSVAVGLLPLLTYRALGIEKGYQVHERWTESSQLANDLDRYYGKELLAACGSSVPAEDFGKTWPALMLRPSIKVPFAPVKHVLLATFLAARSTVRQPLTKKPPGKKPRDYGLLDKELALRLKAALTNAVRDGVRLEIRQLFAGTGLWETYRHQSHRLPLTRAMVFEYRRSNVAERQIGRRPQWRSKSGPSQMGSPPSVSQPAQEMMNGPERGAEAIACRATPTQRSIEQQRLGAGPQLHLRPVGMSSEPPVSRPAPRCRC